MLNLLKMWSYRLAFCMDVYLLLVPDFQLEFN